MKLDYQDKTKEDWFLVSWTLSNKCNYKCSYCPDILHNGTTGQPKWETVKNFVENFKVPSKEICYRLSGGEPTYWKHFIDLAKLVKEQGHTFSFVTNGSQSVDYFKKIDPYTDGMLMSYHPEYSSSSHFVEIANATKCEIIVNLMLPPGKEAFDEQYKIAQYLFDRTDRMSIYPKVILDKTDGEHITNTVSPYSSEQKEIIGAWPFARQVNDENLHRGDLKLDEQPVTAKDLIISGMNNFAGWKCWAGIDGVNVDMWGNLYRADCQFGGPIGNMERYRLPTEPITCGKTVCGCLSDIYIRKDRGDGRSRTERSIPTVLAS